jgi:hypothetical protein
MSGGKLGARLTLGCAILLLGGLAAGVTAADPSAPAGVAQGPPAMSVAGAPAAPAPMPPPAWRRESSGARGGLGHVVDQEPLPDMPGGTANAGGLIAEDSTIRVTIRIESGEIGAGEEPRYVLEFDGKYTVRNPDPREVLALFAFPFPANTTFKWDTEVLVDGKPPTDAKFTKEQVTWSTEIPAGRSKTVRIAYKTRGASRFTYELPRSYRARNLDVLMTVYGKRSQIEVPETALEPTVPLHRTEDGSAWAVAWQYADVVVDRDIEVLLGTNHKPLFATAAIERLRWLAVVFIALFVGTLVMAGRVERREIAPHAHLLAALCLFLFYPLLVFASGYMALPYALALALGIVSVMILRYVSAVTDVPFALKYAGSALVVFLGFSCVVILAPKAIGLAAVVAALVLIGLSMEITLRGGLTSTAASAVRRPEPPVPAEPQPQTAPHTQQGG